MYDRKTLDTNKKNVIWIVSDQHRAHALSCNGDPNIATPNLDRLSAAGINFTSAVSGYPLCCPFRGSMFTGLYPHKCIPGHQLSMKENQKTIADVFNENGYHTVHFGKWHVAGGIETHEERVAHFIVPYNKRGGFKTWIGYENNNNPFDTYLHGHIDGEEVPLDRHKGYETDILTDRLVDYIKEDREQPFFAVLAVTPPHDPYVAPAEFMKKHTPANVVLRENVPNVKRVVDRARVEIAGYNAAVENLDWNIGRVLEALEDTDKMLDTHILFFSDHGDMLGSHGHFRKTSPYEESIRIPFIISGELPHYSFNRCCGNRDEVLINHVDIAPTTLGLCGIKQPEWMTGVDYSHYRLLNNPVFEEPDSAFIQGIIPIKGGDGINKPWRAIVTKDKWKYACFEDMEWLLFDLNEDPYEQINLAHSNRYRSKLRELNEKLREWIVKTEDVFKLPII